MKVIDLLASGGTHVRRGLLADVWPLQSCILMVFLPAQTYRSVGVEPACTATKTGMPPRSLDVGCCRRWLSSSVQCWKRKRKRKDSALREIGLTMSTVRELLLGDREIFQCL